MVRNTGPRVKSTKESRNSTLKTVPKRHKPTQKKVPKRCKVDINAESSTKVACDVAIKHTRNFFTPFFDCVEAFVAKNLRVKCETVKEGVKYTIVRSSTIPDTIVTPRIFPEPDPLDDFLVGNESPDSTSLNDDSSDDEEERMFKSRRRVESEDSLLCVNTLIAKAVEVSNPKKQRGKSWEILVKSIGGEDGAILTEVRTSLRDWVKVDPSFTLPDTLRGISMKKMRAKWNYILYNFLRMVWKHSKETFQEAKANLLRSEKEMRKWFDEDIKPEIDKLDEDSLKKFYNAQSGACPLSLFCIVREGKDGKEKKVSVPFLTFTTDIRSGFSKVIGEAKNYFTRTASIRPKSKAEDPAPWRRESKRQRIREEQQMEELQQFKNRMAELEEKVASLEKENALLHQKVNVKHEPLKEELLQAIIEDLRSRKPDQQDEESGTFDAISPPTPSLSYDPCNMYC